MLEEVHHLELIRMPVFIRSILKCLRLLSPHRFRLDYLVPTAALSKRYWHFRRQSGELANNIKAFSADPRMDGSGDS